MMGLGDILNENLIFKPSEIDEMIKHVRTNFRFSYTNKKLKYFNVPAAFDIETSSFFRTSGNDEEKCACMYVWQLGIYGAVMMGRTWCEFVDVINRIHEILDLNENKRLIIYVHNLAYEFQFMRKYFLWDKVFAIDVRKPIYAITGGIEFRCSYLLSGYNLAKLGEQLHTYKVSKMVGDLDYSKIRHSGTPLTEKEIGYCVNDVKVVMSYIAERIDNDGSISKIPITKTGYVRNYCRNAVFYKDGVRTEKDFTRKRYLDYIHKLTIEPDEYVQLKDAFQGGFTHANPFYSGRNLYNVTSFDFTSSYPTVMIAEQFPISPAEIVPELCGVEYVKKPGELFTKNLNLYCCLFDVTFTGLESVLFYDSYISFSKCRNKENVTVNNGRIVRADKLTITITECDFNIINKFYEFETMKIGIFRRYRKGYLPTNFVKSILKLYGDKTSLKGVENKEIEYLHSKGLINACFGMIVTDICREKYEYGDEWENPKKPDIAAALAKYNKSSTRFLYYPWGVGHGVCAA